MRHLYIIISFSAFIFAGEFFAIEGIVLNNDNQKPIAGVNIIIENDDNGTSSDDEGRFSIELKAPNENKLVFTMIGFKDTSVVIDPVSYTHLRAHETS